MQVIKFNYYVTYITRNVRHELHRIIFISVSIHNYNNVNHSAYTRRYSRIIIEIFDKEII